MSKRIRDLIAKIVDKNTIVKNKILKRRQALHQAEIRRKIYEGDDDNVENPDLYKTWFQFRPPLAFYNDIFDHHFRIDNVKMQLLEDSWNNRKPLILEIQSYNNILALFLYASINGIVRGKSQVKNNRLTFKETMCCDELVKDREKEFRNPLSYFKHESKSIQIVLEQSKKVHEILENLHFLQTAPFMGYHLPFTFSTNLSTSWTSQVMKKVIQQHIQKGNALQLDANVAADSYPEILQKIAQTKIYHKNKETASRNHVLQTKKEAFVQNIQILLANGGENNLFNTLLDLKTENFQNIPSLIQTQQRIRLNVSKIGEIHCIKKILELKTLQYTFFKNAIREILVYFPQRIIRKNLGLLDWQIYISDYISKHFGFSDKHQTKLFLDIQKPRKPFCRYYHGSEFIDQLFPEIEEKGLPYVNMMDNFPEESSA